MTREDQTVANLKKLKSVHNGSYGADIDRAIRVIKQDPCEDCVSRQAVTDAVENIIAKYIPSLFGKQEKLPLELTMAINDTPPVTPTRKKGKWIEIAKYSDGMHKIACSECKTHIFDRGHANSIIVKNKYKYCPNCGTKMENEDT